MLPEHGVFRRIEACGALCPQQIAALRRLTSLVSQQVLDKEKLSSMLLGIFGSVVEAHNGENNQHILRVRTITEALLHQLAKETPRYRLTEEEIIRIGVITHKDYRPTALGQMYLDILHRVVGDMQGE